MNWERATPGGALAQPHAGLAGLLGDARRSWMTGWANRMIRSTRVPEAAATCSGVSPARMRAWMTRGRQFGAEVDVDLGQPAGVPAGRGAQRGRRWGARTARRSPPSVPSAASTRLFPSSESATRRSVRMATSWTARPVPETRPEPEAIGARRARRAGRPAWRARGASRRAGGAGTARAPPMRARCHVFATRTRHSGPRRRGRARRCDGQPDDRRRPVAPPSARPTAAGAPRGHRDRRCAAAPGAPRCRRRATASPTSPTAPGSRGWRWPRSTADAAGRAVRARRGGRLRRLVAGRRLARLPGQPRRLDLRRAARRASRRQRPPRGRRPRTRAPPSSRAAGPGRAPTPAPSPPATAPTPTSSWSTPPPARTAPSPAAASSSVTSVSAGERFVLARRGPRGYRHIVVIDVATGVQRQVLGPDAPGGIASEDGRFGPDGRSVYVRASLPGAPFADRAGPRRGPAVRGRRPGRGPRRPLPSGRRPGRLRAARPTAPCSPCGTSTGSPNCWCTTLSDGSLVREIALPEPVLPGWSLSADGATHGRRADRPAGAARPVARPARPATRRPALLPSAPPRPDPAVLVTPVRHDYVAPDGLPLSGWLYTPPGVHGPNRTVVSFHGGPEGQERPDWSPVAQCLVAAGFTVFAPNVRGSGGFGRAFMTADDGPAREASFDDVRTTVDELVAAGIAEPGGSARTAGPTAAT